LKEFKGLKVKTPKHRGKVKRSNGQTIYLLRHLAPYTNKTSPTFFKEEYPTPKFRERGRWLLNRHKPDFKIEIINLKI